MSYRDAGCNYFILRAWRQGGLRIAEFPPTTPAGAVGTKYGKKIKGVV